MSCIRKKKMQQFVVLVCLMGKMEKKENTMTHSKILSCIALLLLAFIFLHGSSVSFGNEIKLDFLQQEKVELKQKPETQQVEQEKEKKTEEEEGDIDTTIKKRRDEGESLFEIIGIPSAEDYLPGTFEIVLLWLIPFTVIVGVVILIIIVTKRRHQRILAMIEKGILPDASAIKDFKAIQFRWDVFVLLTGLILGLGGIGFSMFMMGKKGVDQWYTGIIPILFGVALLVFYQIFYKKKRSNSNQLSWGRLIRGQYTRSLL